MTMLFRSAPAPALVAAFTTGLAAAAIIAFTPAPALCAAGVLAERAEAAVQSDLRVRVTGLSSSDGEVRFAVYDSEAAYAAGEHIAQAILPADRNGVAATFDTLAAGRYAVIVFHDANANGALDRNVLGMPTERYGFSGGAAPRMRQARWDEAAFAHAEARTVTIALMGAGQ